MKRAVVSADKSDRHWPKIFWGLFLAAALLTIAGLSSFSLPPYRTHDNNYEVWLHAFDQLIRAGQLFPGWVKDFWFEHGSPLFIAYPPMFFYLAMLPKLLGFGLVISTKLAVIISTLAAFFSMYLLGRELAGKYAGLIAGLVYLLFPYHLALIYIRGAYSENLAYAIIPLVFWFSYRLFKHKSSWDVVGLGVSSTLLLLSNLPTALAVFQALILWLLMWWWIAAKLPWKRLLLGAGLGAALSAWFWLPLLLVRPLMQTEYMIAGPFDFSRHFTNPINWLPLSTWSGTIYFQWGWAAWIVVALAVWWWWRSRRSKMDSIPALPLLLGQLVIFALLMTGVTAGLWRLWPGLTYIQFPYRWLLLIALVVAILTAMVMSKLAPRWTFVLFGVLLFQSFFFADPIYGWRMPLYRQDIAYTVYGDIKTQLVDPQAGTDINGQRVVTLHTAETAYLPRGIGREVLEQDYYEQIIPAMQSLPYAQAVRYTLPPTDKIMTPGQTSDFQESATTISFTHTHDKSAKVYSRQFGFPGWRIWIDGKLSSWRATTGQLEFVVPAGTHQVKLAYTNPPGAILGRLIALLAILITLWWWFWSSRPKVGVAAQPAPRTRQKRASYRKGRR